MLTVVGQKNKADLIPYVPQCFKLRWYLLLPILPLFIIGYSRLSHNTLTDWGLNLSILSGLAVIALAIGFGLGKRLNDFLNETRRGLVDEKIAMLYGYANDVKNWDSDIEIKYKPERIKSDMRSLGRMKKAIQQGQKEDLVTAKDDLLVEMNKNSKLKNAASDIDRVFSTWLS